MNMNTKKWLILWLVLGLAGYCTYSLTLSCRTILQHQDNMASFGIAFWGQTLIDLAGVLVYSIIALGAYKNSITYKTMRWFQIFSGVFAGAGTIPLWIWLFPEVAEAVFTASFYQWLVVCVSISAVAMVMVVGITRLYCSGMNYRRLFISFIAVSLLFAFIQIGKKYGIANIDPRLLLAGIGFGALAYFFPSAARMLIQMVTILFAGIFAIVGGIFNRRDY